MTDTVQNTATSKRVKTPSHPPLFNATSAREAGYKACLECGELVDSTTARCPLCNEPVFIRKPDGLNKASAYLVTAIILFFPANWLPVMTTTSILGEQSDTILSGVLHLWQGGSYPIAIIVFVASFITPLFKMTSIAYLCFTCHRQSTRHIRFRTKLYHFTELIGRWSMIDVFVVALLGALVQMGSLASVSPDFGIVAFSLVVFLTMFSTAQFDPRLIWDSSRAGFNDQATGKMINRDGISR
ncbi:MAG: paraquat-inducible membrane protein A [Gammaproteobacteria bacterium]|nr:MAG: paraquat-inducible membrane protein A [Gammaproteobacteria bacterium]